MGDQPGTEFAGLLIRDNGGFVLKSDNGMDYRLILLRTPIDLVEKRVIVTGNEIFGTKPTEAAIEVDGVRLADAG